MNPLLIGRRHLIIFINLKTTDKIPKFSPISWIFSQEQGNRCPFPSQYITEHVDGQSPRNSLILIPKFIGATHTWRHKSPIPCSCSCQLDLWASLRLNRGALSTLVPPTRLLDGILRVTSSKKLLARVNDRVCVCKWI